jgi:hypothetical protein
MRSALQIQFVRRPILATISDSVMGASGNKKFGGRPREQRDSLQICNTRHAYFCRVAWQNGSIVFA